jgi:hypothetical protein
VLKLPLIKNKKTVNPRDSSSAPVFQLETAMGSAIECFDDSGAVVVPRERFAPVKTTNDLFGLRSDAFKVSVRLSPSCCHAAGRYTCASESLPRAAAHCRHYLFGVCNHAHADCAGGASVDTSGRVAHSWSA